LQFAVAVGDEGPGWRWERSPVPQTYHNICFRATTHGADVAELNVSLAGGGQRKSSSETPS
ncbi:MAG: hypothetical protein ACKVKF_23955, partial [Rhodobacterales bacterium]